ncbi:ImmA/IrrE family metallo-endopeptidase [Bacillaceae bacterium Marseille-Q3522]|nr:ImmA/IrrE family metallo-endopeptidase [Bacillaceae bacterium Marseille-Q3522]
MQYEKLLKEAASLGVQVYEKNLRGQIKGLYSDNVIWLNKSLSTNTDKYCTLAEELGHYHTSAGDILDQNSITNRKQEKRARNWAYKKLVPLNKIVQAHKQHVKNNYELAEFLGVTEQFLEEALERYRGKFGDTVSYGGYVICFNPLGVVDWFEDHV